MQSSRVIVVGSVNVDLVVIAPRLPGPGETVTGGDVARHHGGKGGNQAVAAARLGADVSFVGAVGIDDLGEAAREALADEGIGLEMLGRVHRPTGVALIVVDMAGENLIAVAPGANEAVSPAVVTTTFDRLRLNPGDVILACREIPPASVRAALAAARAAGATGILNPAPADSLDGATIALADVLTPNEAELALVTGQAEPEVGARTLLRMTALDRPAPPRPEIPRPPPLTEPGSGADGASGPAAEALGPADPHLEHAARRFVAVTLGAAGALYVPASGPSVRIPAPPVRPVDTTGAGDAFNGALAAGLAAGLEPEAATRRAVAAASLSTLRRGARGGMPTLAELQAAFRQA